MKRCGLFMAIAALALSSCDVVTHRRVSLGSADYSAVSEVRSSKSRRGTSSSLGHSMTSYNFGNDPTSVYEREEKELLNFYEDQFHSSHVSYDSFALGQIAYLRDADSWANVEVIGQKDIAASMRGLNMLSVQYAYGDYENRIPLEGRKFKGAYGAGFLYTQYSSGAYRDPAEAFVRVVFVGKDNIEAITGYALFVVYPCGGPLEASDPDSGIVYSSLEAPEPGPVWLDWKAEVVCEGVHFPKVEGLYQRVDPDRVEAALDIMIENAKGHYFQKAN